MDDIYQLFHIQINLTILKMVKIITGVNPSIITYLIWNQQRHVSGELGVQNNTISMMSALGSKSNNSSYKINLLHLVNLQELDLYQHHFGQSTTFQL